MHYNKLNYVYNALNYKKIYIKLYLKFLFHKVSLQQKSMNIQIDLQQKAVNLIKYE